jgi:hypothetical protein
LERAIRTLKETCRKLAIVPMSRRAFRRELNMIVDWYNDSRPHTTLSGRTPNEVYFPRFPAHRKPRLEPRALWPRGAPCAEPWALTRGNAGARVELHVELYGGRRHLPTVTLRRVA